jgi:hypothetical protein
LWLQAYSTGIVEGGYGGYSDTRYVVLNWGELAMAGVMVSVACVVRYGARHEAAIHLDDLLTRRTRISIEEPHRGTKSAPVGAALVVGTLGWDDARVAAEVELYAARVAAERESQAPADDPSAHAARLLAPNTRSVAGDPLNGAPGVVPQPGGSGRPDGRRGVRMSTVTR